MQLMLVFSRYDPLLSPFLLASLPTNCKRVLSIRVFKHRCKLCRSVIKNAHATWVHCQQSSFVQRVLQFDLFLSFPLGPLRHFHCIIACFCRHFVRDSALVTSALSRCFVFRQTVPSCSIFSLIFQSPFSVFSSVLV